jgi:hypothetical protein
MAKTKGMTDGELVSLLDKAISNANNREGSETADLRDSALKFINGEVDFPHETGKSSVVSNDVADTLHWILPQLLRVFLGSENIGIYEPRKPELEKETTQDAQGNPVTIEKDVSVDRAQQATDYVNYVLMNECRGYSVLHSALYEGLAFGNGLIKHWWDDSPTYVTENFSALTEEAFIALTAGEDADDVEVLEHTAYPDPDFVPPEIPSQEELIAAASEAMAQGVPVEAIEEQAAALAQALVPPNLHDVKIKRLVSTGSLQVRALPHEEFFIGVNDTVIDEEETYICGHAYRETRSNLIRAGYDANKVKELPDAGGADDETKTIRNGTNDDEERDEASQFVDVNECYIRIDYDGDKVSEWRKVVLGGKSGAYTVLSNEEWGDDLPFTDLVPDPVPHRWRGRSLYDEVASIQRVKTALARQMQDNLYISNSPMVIANLKGIKNPDALANRELGATIWTDGDINAAMREVATPFVAGQSIPIMEHWDRVRAMRTGVSDQSMGLEPDTLQDQTATASTFRQAAQYAKMETYARNVSECGMKRLFRCLLRLATKHQDRARVIRLRGEWTEMDPRAWHAEMDVTINTGLGSGSREKDMAVINAVLNEQKTIIAQGGPFNPISDIRKYRDTLAKLVELSGLKSPERYFSEISEDQYQAMKAQAEQPQEPPPDPKMMEAQARLQIEQMKAEQKAQADQQQFQLDMEKTQLELQAMREKMAIELEMTRMESAERIRLMQEEARQKFALKREEIEVEKQLAILRMSMSTGIPDQNITNIPSPV